MRNVLLLIAGVVFAISWGEAKVIYGEDNRMEVFEGTPFQQKIAESAAILIHQNDLLRNPSKPGVVEVAPRTLKEWLDSALDGNSDQKSVSLLNSDSLKDAGHVSFCPSVKYTDQPNPGSCSGFLVAPDLLLTAGHCSKLENFCTEQKWVFGFVADEDTKLARTTLSEDDVYSCKKIVSSTLTMSLSLDYALVQLDRPVVNRTPMKIRNDEKLPDDATLMVIGSPSGLPIKIATSAKVRENIHPFFFRSNLDTFSGNSGSAVVNAVTGIAEGILVRGEDDFRINKKDMCIEAKVCDDNGCKGEDVTRLTVVPEIGVQRALNKAAEAGDMANLRGLLELNTWVDFYGRDGVTALMKAALGGKAKAITALLAKGAEVNRQDVTGSSPLHFLAPALTDKNADAFTALISAGASLEKTNANGETPLHIAAKKLNFQGIKVLIQNGANKNAVDNNGETILFSFARKGQKKIVNELIKLGVDASIKNNQGLTYSGK